MTENFYLSKAAKLGIKYRTSLVHQSPFPKANPTKLRNLFDVGLEAAGKSGDEVIEQLSIAASAGLVGSTGDAFYGWVMGGSDSVGVAADWLTSIWGQNAAIFQTSPAAAIAEEVCAGWLLDLLKLPSQCSMGFTSGATMGSFICLAAARSEVLKRAGWDLETDGIFGAPQIHVFISEEAHISVYCALRYLGFGSSRIIRIIADDNGRMCQEDLATKIKSVSGAKIVIAQAGHINTGAFDDFNSISAIATFHDAWMHVDGAFGMWANASPDYAHLCEGIEAADSWAVDGHKWLQIPYDSGFAIVKNEAAHKRVMATSAGYLNRDIEDGRNPSSFVPELSRRAHGFTVWAVLQKLGRNGIAQLVSENCANAAQLARRLADVPGIEILHDVVLNQLCLRFGNLDDDHTCKTLALARAMQKDARWFIKEANWNGKTVLRFSFSSQSKTAAQIDTIADAIIFECQKLR